VNSMDFGKQLIIGASVMFRNFRPVSGRQNQSRPLLPAVLMAPAIQAYLCHTPDTSSIWPGECREGEQYRSRLFHGANVRVFPSPQWRGNTSFASVLAFIQIDDKSGGMDEQEKSAGYRR